MNSDSKRYFRHILTVTILNIVFVCAIILGARAIVRDNAEDACRNTVENSAIQFRNEIAADFREDADGLKIFANLIEPYEPSDHTETARFIKNFRGYKTVSHLEMLTSDNKLIEDDGDIVAAPEGLTFAEEAERGEYFSELTDDWCGENDKIVREAVPVIKDGETVAMLYGIVDLAILSKTYQPEIYMGNAAISIVEGKSGDYIMDTWHDTLGNIKELGDREYKKGFEDIDMLADLENGNPNYLVFVSKTTGEYLYTYYAPVGINDWMIVLNVPEAAVFVETKQSLAVLYALALILMVTVTMYFLWLLIGMKKISMIDPLTGLRNREYYERLIRQYASGGVKKFSCVYIDANGLHALNNSLGHDAGDKMLRCIADNIRAVFGKNCYRIGGDEFVVFVEGMSKADVYRIADEVRHSIENKGYDVSYGIQYVDVLEDICDVVDCADKKMRNNKYSFYQRKRSHSVGERLMFRSKLAEVSARDTGTFLKILAPRFYGVYIVNLDRNDVRAIYIQERFEKILEDTDGDFFDAIRLYSQQQVTGDNQRGFSMFFDKNWLISRLDSGESARYSYERGDGAHITLKVEKSSNYNDNHHETIWLFEVADKRRVN